MATLLHPPPEGHALRCTVTSDVPSEPESILQHTGSVGTTSFIMLLCLPPFFFLPQSFPWVYRRHSGLGWAAFFFPFSVLPHRVAKSFRVCVRLSQAGLVGVRAWIKHGLKPARSLCRQKKRVRLDALLRSLEALLATWGIPLRIFIRCSMETPQNSAKMHRKL